MAFLLTGDSIAVGLAAYLHADAVHATVGQGSARGAAIIMRDPHRRLVVSLGVNDSAWAAGPFEQRVRMVLQGRECVVWLTMRRHPAFNQALRHVARNDARLHVVRAFVPTVDGIHPDANGYRTLTGRVRRVLHSCRPTRWSRPRRAQRPSDARSARVGPHAALRRGRRT